MLPLPLEKAKATGATLINPKRYEGRSEPESAPLGEVDRSKLFLPPECEAFECFRREVPWLKESDRRLVECASKLQAKVWIKGEVTAINALLRCLSLMGATPTDRQKVYQKPAEVADPAEDFLQ